MPIDYEDSKEIIPGRERQDLRYLGLIRERVSDVLVLKILLSTTERPQNIVIGEAMYYPDSFSDVEKGRQVFRNISSVHDFNREVEASRKR